MVAGTVMAMLAGTLWVLNASKARVQRGSWLYNSSHHCHTNSAYPVHGFLECEPSFDIQPNFHRTVSPAKYGPKLPRISEIKAREVIEADLRENIERSLTQVSGTNAATGIDRRAVE